MDAFIQLVRLKTLRLWPAVATSCDPCDHFKQWMILESDLAFAILEMIELGPMRNTGVQAHLGPQVIGCLGLTG